MLSNTTIHDIHSCSIEDMFGKHSNQGNTLMLLATRTFCTILAVWDLVLC